MKKASTPPSFMRGRSTWPSGRRSPMFPPRWSWRLIMWTCPSKTKASWCSRRASSDTRGASCAARGQQQDEWNGRGDDLRSHRRVSYARWKKSLSGARYGHATVAMTIAACSVPRSIVALLPAWRPRRPRHVWHDAQVSRSQPGTLEHLVDAVDDPKPVPWCVPPLAWRIGFRQLRRPLPLRPAVVVGNVLAGRGILQLDHDAVADGVPEHPRPARRARRDALRDAVLLRGVRHAVGYRESHVRPLGPVSRRRPGHGDGARVVRRCRYACRAVVPRRVHGEADHAVPREDHPGGCRSLPGRGLHHRPRRPHQGTRDAAGPETRPRRRVQLPQGRAGRRGLGRLQRVLRVRARQWQSDQGPHPAARHRHHLAGAAGSRRRAGRGLLHQRVLVHLPEHQEPHRLPVLQ